MAASVVNKIEYLVLLVAAFATGSNVSEAQAYRYLICFEQDERGNHRVVTVRTIASYYSLDGKEWQML